MPRRALEGKTTGRFDVVDIVESDDPEQVTEAAMVIRASGYSTTASRGVECADLSGFFNGDREPL